MDGAAQGTAQVTDEEDQPQVNPAPLPDPGRLCDSYLLLR